MRENSEEIKAILSLALKENQRQLGAVYRIDPELKLKAAEVVERGGAANSGAVGNIRCAIRAILDGVIPESPTVARQVIGAINSLRRENPNFSLAISAHLDEVVRNLNERATSKVYREEEAELRQTSSNQMLQVVEQRGGVYAYSLPHYLNFPCKEDPERFWYKIGCTTGNFESRVVGSHRQTGLPEDPIIRRTYFSSSLKPKEMEEKFHFLLGAAGLATDSVHGGIEWFATTENQLDSIAEILGFEIFRPDEDYE